jgi:hypothetical protein
MPSRKKSKRAKRVPVDLEKDPSMSSSQPPVSSERARFFPNVVYLALDVADRGGSSAIALLQGRRAELRAATDGAIEATENATRAAFLLARKVSQRLDEASAETLAKVERVVQGALKAARETAHTAAALAGTRAGA